MLLSILARMYVQQCRFFKDCKTLIREVGLNGRLTAVPKSKEMSTARIPLAEVFHPCGRVGRCLDLDLTVRPAVAAQAAFNDFQGFCPTPKIRSESDGKQGFQ